MALGKSRPAMWEKPAKVEIEGGYLVAEFGSRMYPIEDAINRARALQRLTQVETGEDAKQFTADWGFFCRGWGNERKAVFPLRLFFLVRGRLVALARLASACHDGSPRKHVLEATREVDSAVDTLYDYYWDVCPPYPLTLSAGPSPPEPVPSQLAEHRRQLLRPDLFTEPAYGDYWMKGLARIWFDHSPDDVVMLRPNRPRSNVADAWDTLAGELSVYTELQATKKQGREWRLEERPTTFNLEVAIIWSIRSMPGVLHFRSCESCQRPFLASRRDRRYCDPGCGSRERVKKFRRLLKDEKQRTQSGEATRVGRQGRTRQSDGR